jgi:hypothetical protein
MPLTVTEKEHLKALIEKRINKKIAIIWRDNAADKEHLNRDAHAAALDDFDIAGQEKEILEAEKEINKLQEAIKERQYEMLAKIDGIELKQAKEEYSRHYNRDTVLSNKIKENRQGKFDEMLVDHPTLGEVHKLEQEKERLLETVWIATSTKQVKELMSALNSVLKEDSTPLGDKAMEIDPTEE